MTDAELCAECLKRLDFESMAQFMVEAFSDYSWDAWTQDGEKEQAIEICKNAFRPQLQLRKPA